MGGVIWGRQRRKKWRKAICAPGRTCADPSLLQYVAANAVPGLKTTTHQNNGTTPQRGTTRMASLGDDHCTPGCELSSMRVCTARTCQIAFGLNTKQLIQTRGTNPEDRLPLLLAHVHGQHLKHPYLQKGVGYGPGDEGAWTTFAGRGKPTGGPRPHASACALSQRM